MPYPVLGLFAGVFVDRWPRRTVLVWAGIGRAVSLALIPGLWWLGVLQVWVLVCLLLVFRAFAVFGFAATQSFLPRLVPRDGLGVRLACAPSWARAGGPPTGTPRWGLWRSRRTSGSWPTGWG